MARCAACRAVFLLTHQGLGTRRSRVPACGGRQGGPARGTRPRDPREPRPAVWEHNAPWLPTDGWGDRHGNETHAVSTEGAAETPRPASDLDPPTQTRCSQPHSRV